MKPFTIPAPPFASKQQKSTLEAQHSIHSPMTISSALYTFPPHLYRNSCIICTTEYPHPLTSISASVSIHFAAPHSIHIINPIHAKAVKNHKETTPPFTQPPNSQKAHSFIHPPPGPTSPHDPASHSSMPRTAPLFTHSCENK